jgi:transcriptional regulator NrdR family protein
MNPNECPFCKSTHTYTQYEDPRRLDTGEIQEEMFCMECANYYTVTYKAYVSIGNR